MRLPVTARFAGALDTSRSPFPATGTAGRLSAVARSGMRAGFVAGITVAVALSRHLHGTADSTVLAVLLLLAGAGYIAWGAATRRRANERLALVAFALLAVAGGALGAFAGVGVAYIAVLAIAAGDHLDDKSAIAFVLLALVSLTVAVALTGAPWVVLAWAALIAVGGLMAGMNRRQYRLRAEQSEQLLQAREATEAEAAHAAALAERNRIAREVHDVLAHSLSALAVQLEALDALVTAGDVARAAETVERARRLAVEGLDETRRAVHALREAPVALAEQVESLAQGDSASFRLEGTERPLPADAGLALYRAAQEALTNARKHAPGAAVSVVLAFGPDRTLLRVVDEYPAGAALPAEGRAGPPGFGLAGMRERVALLGGCVRAGPLPETVGEGGLGGWSVEVELPALPEATGRP